MFPLCKFYVFVHNQQRHLHSNHDRSIMNYFNLCSFIFEKTSSNEKIDDKIIEIKCHEKLNVFQILKFIPPEKGIEPFIAVLKSISILIDQNYFILFQCLID